MIDSKDLEKAIIEGIKAIAYSGVQKPDTPDIDTIEEVNNILFRRMQDGMQTRI